MARKDRPTLFTSSAPVRSISYGQRPELKALTLPRSLQALAAYLDGSCSLRLLPRSHQSHRKSVLAIWGIPLPTGMLVVTLRAQPGGHRLDLHDCRRAAPRGDEVTWVKELTREHGFPRLSSTLAFTAIGGYGHECVSEERLFIAPLFPAVTFETWREALLPLLPASRVQELQGASTSVGLRLQVDLL